MFAVAGAQGRPSVGPGTRIEVELVPVDRRLGTDVEMLPDGIADNERDVRMRVPLFLDVRRHRGKRFHVQPLNPRRGTDPGESDGEEGRAHDVDLTSLPRPLPCRHRGQRGREAKDVRGNLGIYLAAFAEVFERLLPSAMTRVPAGSMSIRGRVVGSSLHVCRQRREPRCVRQLVQVRKEIAVRGLFDLGERLLCALSRPGIPVFRRKYGKKGTGSMV